MKGCRKETFKSALDKYLCTIPDEPHIQGYVQMRRADSNSLLDMVKFANCEAYERARVEVAHTPARSGCAPMLP